MEQRKAISPKSFATFASESENNVCPDVSLIVPHNHLEAKREHNVNENGTQYHLSYIKALFLFDSRLFFNIKI